MKIDTNRRKSLLQNVRIMLIYLFGLWYKIEYSSAPRTFYVAKYAGKNELLFEGLNSDLLGYYYQGYRYTQILEFISKDPLQTDNNYRIFGFRIKDQNKNECYLKFNKKFLEEVKELINSTDYQFITYFLRNP